MVRFSGESEHRINIHDRNDYYKVDEDIIRRALLKESPGKLNPIEVVLDALRALRLAPRRDEHKSSGTTITFDRQATRQIGLKGLHRR